MTRPPIYMDCHATTPLDPRVLEAMLPWLGERFGNAASRTHGHGAEAREACDVARVQVARLIGARASEIVFTSGATESDNLALKGVAHALRERGDHLVTVATEHKAVLDSARRLEREGFRVTVLPVDGEGRLDPAALEAALEDRTLLVSVMLANNEVGTVQDLEALGRVTRARGVLLHCDATQGVGRVRFDVDRMNVDLASLSGHKIHGPMGVGALFVRRTGGVRVRLVAEMDGGGHERGMRSGTLNVPGIVGLGRAAELLAVEGPAEAERLRALRDRLWARLEPLGGVVRHGARGAWAHPGNLNVSFDGLDGERLLLALTRTVAVSSGAACSSASVEPSYVLRALGVSPDLAAASIRFGLGRHNTADEVERVADAVAELVPRLREGSEEARLAALGVDPADIDW